MPDRETIYLRGEGGVVKPHDLPLPWGVAHRLEKGYLKRVQADGSPWSPEPDASPDPQQGVTVASKPATNAPKASWVGYAVTQGADPDAAEAMTKHDLIDKYGQ